MKAYARFTCSGDDKTVTVETDCATPMCDSCKDRRERLAVPACFMVQHGAETESITVNCAHGMAVVNVYTFLSDRLASCPIGTGAMLESSGGHMSGQCEVDGHGHHEHNDINHHNEVHHDDDHSGHHDEGDNGIDVYHGDKAFVVTVKHVIDVICLCAM